MAFEGLDIEIGGSAGGAQAAISSTRRALGGLSRAASGASDSVEELGDAVTGTAGRVSALGTTVGATTLSLTGLSASATGATGSLTSLSITAGTLTTALVGLSAALAPLAATLGGVAAAATGLAGAFGAVVGSGLIAFGEERASQNREQLAQIRQRIAELERLEDAEGGLTAAQAKELEQLETKADKVEETTSITGALAGVVGDLKEEITPLVVALGQQFIPLIRDAVDALPTLVERTIDALGPLEQFAAAARAFGGELLEFVPAATAALFDLAREALPVLADGLRFLRAEGGDIFRGLLRTTRQVGPLLLDLGRSFGRLLPELTRFGIQILNVVVPALEGFLGTLNDVLQIQGDSSGIVDFLGRIIDRAVAWFDRTGASKLKSLGAAVLDGLAAALDPDGEGEGGFTSALIDRLGNLLDRTATWLTEEGGSEQIGTLISDLFGQIATALSNVSEEEVQALTNSITAILSGVLDGVLLALNSEEAGSLGQQLGRLAGITLRTFADALVEYASSEAFIEDLGGLASGIANSVGRAILAGVTQIVTSGGIAPSNIAAAGIADAQDGVLLGTEIPAGGGAVAGGPGRGGGATNTTIEVEVTGDTDVVGEVAAREIESETRDTNRRSGRGLRPGL
jgi:hypothetical protein